MPTHAQTQTFAAVARLSLSRHAAVRKCPMAKTAQRLVWASAHEGRTPPAALPSPIRQAARAQRSAGLRSAGEMQ